MDAISKENWKRCAADLNIEIQVPFCVEIDNQPIELILFKNFGSQMGTLVFDSFNVLDTIEKKEDKQIKGYNISIFDYQLLHYDEEVQDSVIEMLTEWGWTGSEDKRPFWLLDASNLEKKLTYYLLYHFSHQDRNPDPCTSS